MENETELYSLFGVNFMYEIEGDYSYCNGWEDNQIIFSGCGITDDFAQKLLTLLRTEHGTAAVALHTQMDVIKKYNAQSRNTYSDDDPDSRMGFIVVVNDSVEPFMSIGWQDMRFDDVISVNYELQFDLLNFVKMVYMPQQGYSAKLRYDVSYMDADQDNGEKHTEFFVKVESV